MFNNIKVMVDETEQCIRHCYTTNVNLLCNNVRKFNLGINMRQLEVIGHKAVVLQKFMRNTL